MAKRRPSGDGMVRKKEDGSWEGRVVIGYDEKNLPKTKNVLAKTKSECVEKLKQLQEQYAPPKSDKIKLEMPFGEWMDFWYQNYSIVPLPGVLSKSFLCGKRISFSHAYSKNKSLRTSVYLFSSHWMPAAVRSIPWTK